MSRQDKIGLGAITVLVVLLLVYMSLYHVKGIPEKRWREFHKITGKELMIMCTKLFFNTEYKNGGKSGGELDCSGAYEKVVKGLGARFKSMNAWSHGQALMKYGYRRRTFDDVQPRDVIVFNRIQGIGHIGIVVKVDKKSGKIYYWEQTKKTNGYNFNWVKYVKSTRVYGIFYVTPSYFYGERL